LKFAFAADFEMDDRIYWLADEITREIREIFPCEQSSGQTSTWSSTFAVSAPGNSATVVHI
jgi:hypothetical protein